MKALFALCLTACSYTTNNIYTTDADTDVQVESSSDASVETDTNVPSPNAWVYDQPNLSLKSANCDRIIGDSGKPFVLMTYTYTGYTSALPIYICSTNISDACDIEQLISNTPAYYSTPAPILVDPNPNTLTSDCHLINTPDSAVAILSPTILEWYEQGTSPYSLISDCGDAGGSLYVVMLQLYNQDFQAQIDKDTASHTVFQCE